MFATSLRIVYHLGLSLKTLRNQLLSIAVLSRKRRNILNQPSNRLHLLKLEVSRRLNGRQSDSNENLDRLYDIALKSQFP